MTEKTKKFPRLETARLILREMTIKDIEFYFHHFNDEKVIQGSCFPGPKSLRAAREELELYCINPFKENRGIRWGILMKGSSNLIGTCGFYDWNKHSCRAEIGYDLNPSFWGQGIMREALQAILTYGFRKMKLNRIQAIIDSENTRSMNVVSRLGFGKEGVLRQRSFFKGKFRDDVLFSLLKEGWKNQ